MAEELGRKTEDASRQQEEITHLLSQIVDLQKKAKMVESPKHISHNAVSSRCWALHARTHMTSRRVWV